jgi:fibronectin-binding autotransporter adhesin
MTTSAWVDSSGGRHTWNNANNDQAQFLGGTGPMTVTLDSAVTAATVTFVSAGYTLGGSALTLTGGDTAITATESVTINAPINVNADQQWTVATGETLTIGGTVSLGSHALTVDGAGNATAGGVISGEGGSLTKTGSGALTLSAVNTYNGLTDVQTGKLQYGVSHAIDDDCAVAVSGGTLDLQTYIDTVGAVTLTNNGTITSTNFATALTGSSYTVINGTISAGLAGPGTLLKSRGSIVTLSGNNTYTGLTTVVSGELRLGWRAHAQVISGGGADIKGGKIVFDYTDDTDAELEVRPILEAGKPTGSDLHYSLYRHGLVV